ncbi:hypothetical protein FGF1_36090 [Flavobacteriaceae bacterium GF1]
MYLNRDIDTNMDRTSMAFSLEAKFSLLDYRILEFANRLPTDFKFKAKNQKRILKEILFKDVQEDLLSGPKAGFTMPLKKWFQNELETYVTNNPRNDKSFFVLNDTSYQYAEKMVNDQMKQVFESFFQLMEYFGFKEVNKQQFRRAFTKRFNFK